MVLTSIKTTFPKAVPKELIYRDMKNLDKNVFKRDLKKKKLKQTDSTNHALFEEIFANVLDKHAPKKKKMQRANKTIRYKSNAKSHHEKVRVSNKISHPTNRGKQKGF